MQGFLRKRDFELKYPRLNKSQWIKAIQIIWLVGDSQVTFSKPRHKSTTFIPQHIKAGPALKKSIALFEIYALIWLCQLSYLFDIGDGSAIVTLAVIAVHLRRTPFGRPFRPLIIPSITVVHAMAFLRVWSNWFIHILRNNHCIYKNFFHTSTHWKLPR